MQPAKRLNSSPLGLCGAPAEKVPAPPLPHDEPNTSSLLKAFEAVVAAGRRGLLGPTAKAAVEAVPDADLEGSDGKAGQETPNPVPLVEEKKGEQEEQKEEEEDKEEKEEEKEGKKKGRRKRKKGKGGDTVVNITPPVPGPGSSKPCKKEIWIIGDSVISLSTKRAQFSQFGKQLGLPSSTTFVCWRGIPQMVWDDLIPILHCLYHQRPFPSIIIIHLGGNDLWRDSSSSLATKMQNDLVLLQKALPDVVIIWSSLLPKLVFKASELQDLESKRSNVNNEMEEYCNENGICYLSHPLFTVENKALFHENALSNEGAHIFITDLKEILHTYLNHKKC